MACSVDEAAVMDILRGVRGPAGTGIVQAGLVESVAIQGETIQVALRAARSEAAAMEQVARAAERALAPLGRRASVILTAHKQAAPAPAGERLLADVPAVIAVASGKGGVGKSTVAVNLAVALARAGRRVGLVDADIHGPSLPRMLGLTGKPEIRDGMMQPLQAHGVRCMSIGFMVPEDQAMIWRGPMVMGALQQILSQTHWGALDVMVVDMPPGTGDVQLTMSQRVTLAGAVIVSTPQDIALLDARRGVAMFRKVNVPILGVVENMSFFCCPNCGTRTDLFGHGGARAEAERLGVPFLGEIPLLQAVREAGDAGTPAVLTQGPAATAFTALAQQVMPAP